MSYFDLPLAELEKYRPPLTRQPDFDSFWHDTLREASNQTLHIESTLLDVPYHGVRMFHMTYNGWNEAPMTGTYAVPEGTGPFPGIVIYHGYGGRKPDAAELLVYASQGYAVLAVDVRGQSGNSGDNAAYPDGHHAGYMTMGISEPQTYYYRGVYVDSLRALDALGAQSEVDTGRIGITGGSQGGALTLAVAALCERYPDGPRVRAAFAEVPFLCHFERAVTLVDTHPYREIANYLRSREDNEVERVYRTLSYFDNMNLAEYISAPTQVTVGLMDTICPPSTIFAAYNRISAPKQLYLSRFGEHATFPGVLDARARWFAQHL